jgi:hypothetical protein
VTSLGELAGLARRYAALERRLFEVLGGWVPTVPEPEVKLLLREHSFQHAWHAQLWDELAPRTGPGVGAAHGSGEAAVTGTGRGGLEDALASIAEAASIAEGLHAVYHVVLPELVQDYRALRQGTNPATDGPLLRALGLILADDESAIEAGASLLGVLVGTTGGGEGDAAPDGEPFERLLESSATESSGKQPK